MNTEHIDIGLARYSDWAFTSSVVVLVIVLLFLAVELAAVGSRKVPTANLSRRGRAREEQMYPRSVPTAPPPAMSPTCRSAHSTNASDGPGSSSSTQASACCSCAIVLRGIATARVPWGNMYEFVTITCAAGMVAALRRAAQARVSVHCRCSCSCRWSSCCSSPAPVALHQRRTGGARRCSRTGWPSTSRSSASVPACSWSPVSRASCSCCKMFPEPR